MILACIILLSAGPVSAQEADKARPWLVSLSANYGTWSTSDLDSDGSQALGFLQISYDADSRWGAAVTGAFVNTSYKASHSEERFDISTLTDTDLSTYYSLQAGALTLRGGVDLRIPTGKSDYSEEEYGRIIIDDLSQDLMLLNTYGGGLNVAPHFVAVYKFGRFTGGLGARYEFAGEYDPTSDTDDGKFDPGDRLLLLLNGVAKVSSKDYFLLTVSYSTYSKDSQDGQDVYRQGDTVSAEARYIKQWDDFLSNVVGVVYKTQQKNELISETGSLESELANSNNNSLEVYLNNVYRHSSKLSVTGLVGYKEVGANGYEEGNDYYDAGRNKIYVEPGMSWYFTSNVYSTLRARYSYVKDKQDASSEVDAAYNVFNVDVGLVYSF